MKPEAQVSVIIPTYDRAEELAQCLHSLEGAECLLDVIVCDGLGDEATRSCVHHSPLTIAHLVGPDRGVYDAMNKGIEKARGQWLYFLGSDDLLADKQAFKKLLMVAREDSSVLLGVVENLPPRGRRVVHFHRPVWSRSILLRNTVHHQGALYRADALKDYRYPIELRILGDYHLNLCLWRKGARAVVTDILVARCAPGGLSKKFTMSLYREEWWLKSRILPVGSKWWQLPWLLLKYLRKQF